MEQNSERDYLGRQYAGGSSDSGSSGQYESPFLPDDGGAGGVPARTPAGAGTGEQTPSTANAAVVPPETVPRQLQIGTVVWGLVLTTLAVLMLLVSAVNLSLDPVLVILAVTLGAGVALLAGGFLAATAKNRRR
ncbi:hypothetical protein GD627_04435 [Arthrobacter yangruifuii]|uniref:Uncharacterized protein n=1 Tax=Arthrobacter yangruifuii TaxID=2606616 RepID=A0A5N6MTR0_9MICC|nr:hypothetical protein [Arthrobacter yangruifuii]KAD4060302.1 hypothetical protein GD627_04435 [Arthrobacter yangruifuii]